MLSRKVLYAGEFVSRLVADDFQRPWFVLIFFFFLPILPWKPLVYDSFIAGGFKPRGQPWRTFLVSYCFVVNPSKSVRYPCHVGCADTSHNDLELESEWEPLPRDPTGKANISGRTMDAGNHQLLVCWQTLQYIYLENSPKKIRALIAVKKRVFN